jgi:hypothetical protein
MNSHGLSSRPGFPDWEITRRTKRALAEVIKFKCLSVYFPFTASNDSFACVDHESGSTF